MTSYIDEPTAIRVGEELNLNQLEVFLKDQIPGLNGILKVHQFPAGFSNLTYLIQIGDREMVLRRPPFGRKAKSAHDMGREYWVLQRLKPAFPYCPEVLVYTEDDSVLGCPFYVMERLQGIILRKELPAGFSLAVEEMQQLCKALIEVHAQLHALDYESIGLADLGKPEGYVQRQIKGWSQRYAAARTEDAPSFESVIQWLYDHQPQDNPGALIHNDYKFDNVVLDPEDPLRIIGVLDWEMATLGDPLMDLGSSLAYWIQRDDPPFLQAVRMLPTHIEGAMSRRELIRHYAEVSGKTIENFDFYYSFGLFRLAGIAQQIYYRFYHGQTRDPRFKLLIYAVRGLEQMAQHVIKKSNL